MLPSNNRIEFESPNGAAGPRLRSAAHAERYTSKKIR